MVMWKERCSRTIYTSCVLVGTWWAAVFLALPAAAQSIFADTPGWRGGVGYYERIGVGFSWNQPGSPIFFNQGGFNSAVPPFGGYDPASDARLAFRVGNLQFQLAASQGSQRTIAAQAPAVTMMSGSVAGLWNVQQRPFVTGVVPIVSQRPRARRGRTLRSTTVPSAVSSDHVRPADTGPLGAPAVDLSEPFAEPPARPAGQLESRPLTPIEQFVSGAPMHRTTDPAAETQGAATDSEDSTELQLSADAQLGRLIARAQQAEEVGQISTARLYYQMAMEQLDVGPRREQLELKLRLLRP